MNKEEKIKEMAKIAELELMIHFGDGDIVEPEDRPIQAESIAEAFYKAGYRKAEEVRKETAREIFEYIVKSGVINVAPDTIKMFFKERYGVTAFIEEGEE